ncbi:MAG: signal peptidase I [Clostridia bacterium]|nr:signal peptidase I [Clostridia bacterium]
MKKTNKKTVNFIIRAVVIFIASVFIGIQFYNWNAKNVAGDNMPMPFGVGISVVLSGSMEPELSVDDVIIVKKTDDFGVDDMVVFNDHGILVVHRVISIDGDNITTKGDANNTADEPITRDVVKGKVIKVLPGAGKAFDILRSPLAAVIVFSAAILLMELSFKKEEKEADDDLEPIKAEIRRLLAEKEAAKKQEEPKE